MSVKKLVSIDNVVINLLDDLELDHNKFKPMFVNWAVWAEKQIGSKSSYSRKHKVLTISNCCAELPCEAAILELALLGDFGCECGDLFTRFSLSIPTSAWDNSSGFLVIDSPTPEASNYSFVNYVVQDNKLILDRNYDGQSITIQYLGIETDKNDIPLIVETHIEAIGEYCKYRLKSRNVKSYLQRDIFMFHKNEWEKLACRARGDDADPTEAQRANSVNALHNPLAGRGLQLEAYGAY